MLIYVNIKTSFLEIQLISDDMGDLNRTGKEKSLINHMWSYQEY